MRLLLTCIATAWVVVVAVAFFWVGFTVVTPFGHEASTGYWMAGWMLFGAVGAAPFIVYSALDQC